VNLAPEITAAGAGWVVPLERPALTRTLTAVLLDEEERARRGQAGRRLVCRKFTWSAVAESLAALYGDVADRRIAGARA
jgi:glycosyltransferase involved in cell wall biosynthesis